MEVAICRRMTTDVERIPISGQKYHVHLRNVITFRYAELAKNLWNVYTQHQPLSSMALVSTQQEDKWG